MKVKRLIPLFALSAVTGAAALEIQVDGQRDAVYGAPVALQTVQTDTTSGGRSNDNLNELDAAYAVNDGMTLYLFLAGNLEADASTLEIFFDVDGTSSGQNVISAEFNPNNDNWASRFGGFGFDTGFAADNLIIFRHGTIAGEGEVIDVDFVEIGVGGVGEMIGRFPYTDPPDNGPFAGSNGITIGFDNSNTGGISGGTDAADPVAAAAVDRGVELAIPLSLLGTPPGDIRISAFINNASHIYLTNQFLGGMPEDKGRLGSDGNGTFFGGGGASLLFVDLDNFAGEQFFTVSPFQQPPKITGFTCDKFAETVTVSWDSSVGALYTVQYSTDFKIWQDAEDTIPSQGVITSYPHLSAPTSELTLFYRVFEQ